MKQERIVTILIISTVLFLGGYFVGRSNCKIVERTQVVIDTAWYERPVPFRISRTFTTVHVPRLLFAPRDTVYQTISVPTEKDSVQVEIEMQTLEYRDSSYYARVVGPAIGNLHPELNYIAVYNRTITQTIRKRHRFAVTAGVGAAYTPKGFQPVIGIQAGVVLWGF